MCFSMAWLLQVLILGVLVCAVLKILSILIPYALKSMGMEIGEGVNILVSILRICFIAVIVIVVLVIGFELISCLISWAGGMPSLLPRR